MLDCLLLFVRKFWSPPLVAWKYVKSFGQEFFSYGVLGRSICASQVNKLFTLVVLVFDSLVLLIPIMVMLLLLTLISFQGPTLLNFFLEALLSSEVASCLCCLLKKLLIKVLKSLLTSKKSF